MGLPALKLREKRLYKDLFWAYEPTEDSYGNTNGYALVPMPYGTAGSQMAMLCCTRVPFASEYVAAIPCNAHLTPNFDQPRSPAGQDKVTSFETSNLMTFQRQLLSRPDWIIFIQTRWGDTGWYKIDGDDEREVLVPCSCVFLVPMTPLPDITPPV